MIGDIMNKKRILINNIPSIKKLNKQQTYNLIQKYQETKDPEILEHLVIDNLKLVISMTKRFYQRTENIDDLFQVGTIGLIKAINNFNVNYDLQFSTYAVPLIIGEMKRFIRDDSNCKISRNIKDLAYRALKEKDKYLNEHHCNITNEQLDKRLNVDYESLVEAMLSTNATISMQEEVSNSDDIDLMLIDKLSNNYEINQQYHNTIDLQTALSKLTTFQQRIINQRYFLGLSQSEIGKELSLSQAQISRIEKKAINNLHNLLK